jgi:hypothetical protein
MDKTRQSLDQAGLQYNIYMYMYTVQYRLVPVLHSERVEPDIGGCRIPAGAVWSCR